MARLATNHHENRHRLIVESSLLERIPLSGTPLECACRRSENEAWSISFSED
jgi:hypothetical protein